MRNEVMVDGVRLTRAQVEGALRELNKPDYPTFRGGDIVKSKASNRIYTVLDAYGQADMNRAKGYNGDNYGLCPQQASVWVMTKEGYIGFASKADLTKVLA